MVRLKNMSISVICLLAIATFVLLSSWITKTTIDPERGYIKGRTRAMVRVYEENADNKKGGLLYSDWLQQDEYVSINTERGRIIYDYRYSPSDNWTTDIHAECRGGRENALSIP